MEKSFVNGQFSIAMLNYQRVMTDNDQPATSGKTSALDKWTLQYSALARAEYSEQSL